MDSLITAAAQALAAGDPIGALKRVALRDDPAGLALRGMMSMYLLMGVFHLPPWLRLVSGQRAGAARPDTRRFSPRQGAGA